MFAASVPERTDTRRLGITAIAHAILDLERGEARFFAALAILLVAIRAVAFTLSERISFNSDQAVVGLMAKHLSEFRAFPLFYYGLNYILGVEAWIVAPFFWIARPSVTVLRIPMVILNMAAAVMLVRLITTRLRLRPAIGFIAALPFIVPTPLVAGSFLETVGSSGVEPLLYVLILWMLRNRPVPFGALLALGFLHREFTIYAVPALVLIQAADGSLWTASTGRWAMWMAAGFAIVWLIIDGLRLHLNGLSLALQAGMLGKHACFQVADLPGRVRNVFVACLPVLFGGTTMPLRDFAMRSSAVVGSRLVGWAVGTAITLMLLRLLWLWRLRGDHARVSFGVYLALIGCFTLGAYPLACSATVARYPIVRYLNLALLFPIGCFAAFMASESSARIRSLAVVIFVLWGTANLVDNVRVIRETYVHPQPDPHRELTDFLISHGIRYARASYWDAYVVDFLSRERVIVGSTGPVRIPEYESRVDEHSDVAVDIVREPCAGQMHVAAWCIQLPTR